MTPTIMLAIAACGLVIGTAVGAVGVGGVPLVPILTMALGIEGKRAVAGVASVSNIVAGLVDFRLSAGLAVALPPASQSARRSPTRCRSRGRAACWASLSPRPARRCCCVKSLG